MRAEGPDQAPEEDHNVLLRRVVFLLAGLFCIALVHLMSLAREFLVPVVMAILIAITFRPIIRWLALRGVAPPLSAFIFALLLLVAGLLAGYLLSGPLADWVSQAPQIQHAFSEKMKVVTGPLRRLATLTETLKSVGTETTGVEEKTVVVSEPGIPALLWFATYPAGYMIMFGGAVVLSLFLMASGNLVYERIVHAMPTLTDKKNALRLLLAMEREVSGYLFTLTAINAGVGTAIGLGFWRLA